MRACARTAVHGARGQIAGHLRVAACPRQVAQVLERLGIALAHHVGFGVAVEYVDQLPRVAVGVVCCARRFRIVVHGICDVLPVGHQLTVGALILVGRHHFGGFGRRCGGRAGLGGIGAVQIILLRGRVRDRVILRNGHHDHKVAHRDSLLAVRTVVVLEADSSPAEGLVKPVQLVGMMCKQLVQQHVHVHHLVDGLLDSSSRFFGEMVLAVIAQHQHVSPDAQLLLGEGHLESQGKRRAAPLSGGDLLDLRHQLIIHRPKGLVHGGHIRRRAGRGIPAALRLNDCLRRFQSVQLVEIPLQQGGAVVLRHSHGGAAAVDAVQLHADIRLRQGQRQRQHQRQGQYPTYNSLLHLSPSLRAQQSPLYPVLCSL